MCRGRGACSSPRPLAFSPAYDDHNFAHDVFGIRRHMNRKTAKLEDHFVPRFFRPKKEETVS